jgi:putative transposase
VKERRAMIEPNAELSIRRQCDLLGINRSGLYYEPAATSAEELALMRRIDELHLEYPFYGSRKIARVLATEGRVTNRKCVQRLMRTMGLEAMAPKPNTSRAAPEHPTYPYLLRNLKIDRVNQVWASDITYIPLAQGFAYLVAIIDWHSRLVLAWRLSNTLDTSSCVDALQEALWRYGQPEIFNTDQGAQFTADAFTRVLRDLGVKISMDGKGRCIDNIFVERLWRSLKYEEVYLHAYDSVRDARAGIGRYFKFYNCRRPHQALGYQTPDAYYRGLARAA